jgi:hypothetical protein
MKYCGNITVYADHRDVALKFVYHLTKQLSLGSNGTRPTVFVLIDSILVFVALVSWFSGAPCGQRREQFRH